MNKIKQSIPNAITCCNLLCGCLAIVKAFSGDLVWAAYLVGIAAVFDFFDGFAARMLKVSSPIGKDLDSLADMVTFGVVPGVVMFQLLNYTIQFEETVKSWPASISGQATFGDHWMSFNSEYTGSWLPYIAFLISIFSALRLAKFNNDTRQTDSFIGVPTPANSILICSLVLILHFTCHLSSTPFVSFQPNESWTVEPVTEWQSVLQNFILNRYFLIGLTLVMSFLLVAELPLFALKFKNFKWKGNEIRFLFLLVSVLLFVFLKWVGMPLVIVLYVMMSLLNNIFKKKKEA